MPGASYDERLAVPLRWWALATMFWASVLIAFLVATPAWVALATTLVLVALVAGTFLSYGSAHLTVQDGQLVAGTARIAVSLLGDVAPLDEEAARRVAGRDADARAYLLLRPYVPRAVRVDIADARDPTPYWLLATRHPDHLAAALSAAQAEAGLR